LEQTKKEKESHVTRRAWFPGVFSIAIAVPLPLIWALVYFSPFGSPFGLAVPAASFAPVLAAAILQAAVAAWALDSEDARRLGLRLSLFAVVALGAPVAAGMFLHPDFFSAVFMAIIQGLCLGLYRGELVYGTRPCSPARSGFHRFGLAASILFTGWICLMGYALATRSEPRWMESLIYNVYNALLAAALFYTTLRTVGNAKRTVSASKASFTVDGLDFGPVIGPVACEIAGMLLSSGTGAGCAEIRRRLHGEPCVCDFEDRPGFCADYSTIYNAVIKIRRLVEALRIGTVEDAVDAPSGNRMKWRFLPAEGVETS